MVELLQKQDIKPILVFDGRTLLFKKKTKELRKSTKNMNKKKAEEFLSLGNKQEANKYFHRCLKITKDMIFLCIDMLQLLKVDYIIAPYEADAQIAFLCKNGYVDFAITEDSDLICYNVEKIVYKLDLKGICKYFDSSK